MTHDDTISNSAIFTDSYHRINYRAARESGRRMNSRGPMNKTMTISLIINNKVVSLWYINASILTQ